MSYQVYIETFGCQMNEYDTELIRSLLAKHGFTFTGQQDQADVILMNTCAIRENAHNRVYGHLGDCRVLKRERKVVVGVLGCMAQNLKKELLDTNPVIDVVVGPDAYRTLPALLTRALEQQEKSLAVDLSEYETYDYILPDRGPGVNAWIAVMRGCDNFCTFCVVPYTRGRERSRIPAGILDEAHALASQGYKQITLLGQNVNSYASDDWDFARLLTAIADIPGIERVRFTSPHPKDFPPSLLEVVATHPRVCRHIHLPLQAGNDRILNLMGRSYTRKGFLALVDGIRSRGEISLSTDIICGFCSETEAEYRETYEVVKEVEFQSAFIFKYSERKQTIASRRYPDDVPDQVKSERVTQLVALQKTISSKLNHRLVGQPVEVLIEGQAKKSQGQWMGHTEQQVTVVWKKKEPLAQPGDLVSVTVTDASPSTLFGVSTRSPPSLRWP